MTPSPALELIGIEKSFGSVHANRGVSIAFGRGSIHGLIGENGAGKSTLMKIAYGLLSPDRGEIRIDGRAVAMRGPSDAIAAGIAMVHQTMMLVDRFTILENIVLGTETAGDLRPSLARARAQLGLLERAYGLALEPDRRIRDLAIGDRQMVEIAKALYRDARILILDEPTSVLTPFQTERLFRLLLGLRDTGRTIVLVSHKLAEIAAITDKVTVLRQGEVIGEMPTAETDEDALARMMVGTRVDLGRTASPAHPGPVLLETRGLTVKDRRGVRRVDGIDLQVRAGEITAIAGVAGNGQPELLQALSGILPAEAGQIRWQGERLSRRALRPDRLRARGIAHVPDEPRRFGLVAEFSCAESAILGYHREPPAARRGRLLNGWIETRCRDLMGAFDVRPPDPWARTGSLSGGNQQKLLLGRELSRSPKLLLIGEPTQGMDIAAVGAIQARLVELCRGGGAVLLVSSDLDQIRALADRILVISKGRIVGELSPDEADDRRLGLLMGGVETMNVSAA